MTILVAKRLALAALLAVVVLAIFSPAPLLGVDAADDYRKIDPLDLATRIGSLFAESARIDEHYWRAKPQLAATFAYPLRPSASASDRESVRRLKAGEFQAHQLFPWKKLGVPPPWSENPFDSSTFDFYRHALRWTVPLIDTWACEADAESLELLRRVFEDWIRKNSEPPGSSRCAWGDHATSYRLRIFCWFWELWRRSEAFDPDFAHLLLASIYQHAVYMADERNYSPTSNHALHVDGSLLAAAMTFPEFKASTGWRKLVAERLGAYVQTNFSSDGFHLEQSPSYHWYVLGIFGQVAAFLRANEQPVPEAISDGMRRAIGVWPHLIRPDGAVPNVGDSGHYAPRTWRKSARNWLGEEAPVPAQSTVPCARAGAGLFMLSFRAGYAIFTSYPIGRESPQSDTYALFRCNSWYHSSHCHNDALSFELFGLGREWLVDSGKFNYEEHTPERQYMRAARAHNVVLVDNQDFGFHPITLLDTGRTQELDFVEVRHDMPTASHTRRLEFQPPRRIRLIDGIRSTDGEAHTYTQLFHVAPGLKVEIVSLRQVRLNANDGKACIIEQLGDSGKWSIIEGQKEPFVQGWYSRKFNEMQPSPTLYFSTASRARACKFVTHITLHADPPSPDGRAATP